MPKDPTPKNPPPGGPDEQPQPANEVVLRGRLISVPVERELPSGDVIVTFRLSVARRTRTPLTARSRQSSDWVDCASGAARVRRTVSGCAVGDQLFVEGLLRRRFYRAEGAAATRLEVEAVRVRRERRAESPPVS
jgi:single-strand DNA-binding protein